MKNVLFLLVFISVKLVAQDCGQFTALNHFNTTTNVDFFIEGRGESYPFVKLSVVINPKDKSMMQIDCHAGRGQVKSERTYYNDYNSLSEKKDDNTVATRLAANIAKEEMRDVFNINQLQFTFDDGETYIVYSEPPVYIGNIIFLYKDKNANLFDHFKNNKLTDIKVVFNTMNAEYKLPLLNSFDPKSNQEFFKNLFRCNGW